MQQLSNGTAQAGAYGLALRGRDRNAMRSGVGIRIRRFAAVIGCALILFGFGSGRAAAQGCALPGDTTDCQGTASAHFSLAVGFSTTASGIGSTAIGIT